MAVLAKICKIKKTVISMSSEDDGVVNVQSSAMMTFTTRRDRRVHHEVHIPEMRPMEVSSAVLWIIHF